MGEYTKSLQLYKADVVENANDTFNIETMLNDNWDKIDEKLEKLPIQNGGLYINSETTEEDKAEAKEALFSLGMASLSNHIIKTFCDVKEIGLTKGSETIEDIASKLPPFSMLQMTINSETNNTIYPNSGYGQLFVRKGADATRTFFEHYSKDTGFWYYGWYNGSWSGWIECGNPAGYLPLDGSVPVSGNLTIERPNWIGVKLRSANVGREGRITFAGNDNTTQMVNYTDDNNLSFIKLNKETYNLISMLELVIKKEGGSTNYKIFGEHNKPVVSYTGNGSATSRTIDTGGVGSNCIITGGGSVVFVNGSGGAVEFPKASSNGGTIAPKFYNADAIKFVNGVLTLATSASCVNNNTTTHYVRVF